MLIKNLGQTRIQLLESINQLTDEQLNQKPSLQKRSISQIIYHLYTTEKEMAALILNSLNTSSKFSFQTDGPEKDETLKGPSEDFISRLDLIRLLNESRFKYVQSIFNEIHENQLGEKSINHPDLGVISIENLLNSIWIHEQQHIKQINEMKQGLFK